MAGREEDCHLDQLTHQGFITKMDDRYYYVSISSQSACSSCHAKSICRVSEATEKIIEIRRKEDVNFKVGDDVEVLMKKSMGWKAVGLGYIIPFILLLVSLIAAFKGFDNEGIAGLFSIAVLVLYYIFLYYFRDKIRKIFTFTIRQIYL